MNRSDMMRFGGLLSLVGMTIAADYAKKSPDQIASDVKAGKADNMLGGRYLILL
jgi:hypothetical protein